MGRKEFEKWLLENTELGGGTISSYSSAINAVSKWGNENNIFDQDLYSIDNSNELHRICELLDSSQAYYNKNSTTHNQWSSALKPYKQFVASTNLKSDNNTTDNKTNTEYAWIPFYEELADKLLTFKDNRNELFEIIKKLASENSKMEYLHFERDDWWAPRNYQIDPFSVFGALNRGLTDENRINIAKTFAKEFNLKSSLPTDFLGIPVMNMQKSFFGGNNEVWDLFCEAMICASTGVFTEKFKTAFESAIKAKGNGLATITMGLFWIRPYIYLNLDGQNRVFLCNDDSNMTTVVDILPGLEKNDIPNGEQYLAMCEECKKLFATGEYKFKNFPEMSHYAWLNSKEDINSSENENLQEDFIKWMQQSIKPNGEPYSNGTINAYCAALRNATAKLELDTSLEKTNIFNYTNTIDFNAVHKIILKAPNFSQVNISAGNQAYNAGLEKYSEFLNKISNTRHLFEPKKLIESEMGNIEVSSNNKNEDMEIYTSENFLKEVFMKPEDYDTINNLILRKKNIILQGAPGVGKTFAAKRLAYSIMGMKDESRIKMLQFHQSYAYEDFIMGYRPNETGFELKEGPFYKFCKIASENQSEKYFFIIDEINRGNMSKIFGELMMLIENDKRGEKLSLTYSDELFSVPKNVYIIGTMNTADRSLAIIDYALRRRFSFFELEPAFDNEKFEKYLVAQGVNKGLDEGAIKELVGKIKIKIGSINLEIAKDSNLGKGFKIGHSYFCHPEKSENWYSDVINYEIKPLIEEYWFDDNDKAKGYIDELLR